MRSFSLRRPTSMHTLWKTMALSVMIHTTGKFAFQLVGNANAAFRMRDDFRKNPLVKAHLKAENQYVTAVMADTQALQKALYNEMQQRIPEEDVSVPLRHRTLCIAILRGVLCRLQHYYYYTKSFKGKDFKIHCRRKVCLSH